MHCHIVDWQVPYLLPIGFGIEPESLLNLAFVSFNMAIVN
jgi:hypothetical protein